MVIYDLICANNHRFEASFPSFDSYRKQKGLGLVCCAVCGDNKVEIIPTGGHVVRRADPVKKPKASKPEGTVSNVDMITFIKTLNHYVRNTCVDVGTKFPEEARKIHYGDSEQKNIYGQATNEEREELKEEGIPFSAIPILPDEVEN